MSHLVVFTSKKLFSRPPLPLFSLSRSRPLCSVSVFSSDAVKPAGSAYPRLGGNCHSLSSLSLSSHKSTTTTTTTTLRRQQQQQWRTLLSSSSTTSGTKNDNDQHQATKMLKPKRVKTTTPTKVDKEKYNKKFENDDDDDDDDDEFDEENNPVDETEKIYYYGDDNNARLWLHYFNELKRHLEDLRKEQNLDDNDPAPAPTDEVLRLWLQRQRIYYRSGRWAEDEVAERTALFESIGVPLAPFEAAWERHFEKLKEFVESNNGAFPYEFEKENLDENGRKLLDWVARQKNNYREYNKSQVPNSKMTPDRIAKLEALGFSWNMNEDSWMEQYKMLVKYYEHHGDSLVPTNYPTNPRLAKWVALMRSQKKQKQIGKYSSLTDEREALLEKVDFQWDAWEARWMLRYQELAEFVGVNGYGQIPTQKSNNKVLKDWCYEQRKQYRRNTLPDKRKELLDKLGFPWPAEQ